MPGPRQAGFTYFAVLFALAMIGLALASVATLWATSGQRERERQLLWTGAQYRRAIESFVGGSPAGLRMYPRELAELVTDERGPLRKRHLRRLYADPITGKLDWELIRASDGSIIGVASASHDRPFKQGNFSADDTSFKSAGCYCDWRFLYLPALTGVSPPTR